MMTLTIMLVLVLMRSDELPAREAATPLWAWRRRHPAAANGKSVAGGGLEVWLR